MKTLSILLAGSALLAAPVLAQAPATTTAPAGAPAAAAPAAAPATAATATAPTGGDVAVGSSVSDASGGAVGTITAITAGVATLDTGTTKAGIPVASFAKGPNGLVLGLTKAQVDAQASAAAQQTAQATPAGPPSFEVGAKVSDTKGAQVGTVKAVTGDNVTVASATAEAQLPKTAFAAGTDGLIIGLSPEQFEAAAKAAGGKKS